MRDTMVEKVNAAAETVGLEHVGVKVGMLCAAGGVPLSFVQALLETTQPTVYRWVTGKSKPQHKADKRKMERLVWALTKAVETGTLPAPKFDPDLLLPHWRASKVIV